MGKSSGFWKVAGILAAATVGDGIFALPFVFLQSGWFLGLVYLGVLGAIIVGAHVVYFKTLEKLGERERLLGLARKYFGAGGFWIGFAAIVVGLLLTLVAYLILGTLFIQLGFPNLPPALPLAVFWIFMIGVAILPDGRVTALELAGILGTTIVILLIFVTALPHVSFDGSPLVNPQNFFLPFGAILFSLAGWTGIEPAYESRRRGRRTGTWLALATGTIFAAILYALFAAGVLGTAPHITPDTISGLGDWPAWKRDIVAALGLLAVATVSMPITREIKNSLEKDLHWNKTGSRALIIFFPIVCVLAGFNNFLTVVGLVGGVFLSTQYLLIISVGRRALALSPAKKFALDAIAVVFIVGAIYQIASFIP
jgi:amino acid permease